MLLILDNGTTAMTGLQEHPGTGRTLDHTKTGKVIFEDLARALGVRNVYVADPAQDPSGSSARPGVPGPGGVVGHRRPPQLPACRRGDPRIREMRKREPVMITEIETSAANCHPVSVPDYTPAPELRALQLARLQAVVERSWNHVTLFRDRMEERGLTPASIRLLTTLCGCHSARKAIFAIHIHSDCSPVP